MLRKPASPLKIEQLELEGPTTRQTGPLPLYGRLCASMDLPSRVRTPLIGPVQRRSVSARGRIRPNRVRPDNSFNRR